MTNAAFRDCSLYLCQHDDDDDDDVITQPLSSTAGTQLTRRRKTATTSYGLLHALETADLLIIHTLVGLQPGQSALDRSWSTFL